MLNNHNIIPRMIKMKIRTFDCITLFFILSLLILVTTVPSFGEFNYSLDQKNMIGTWNTSGTSNTTLNAPNHIFLYENEMIISDTGNGRILLYDRSTWQYKSSISNFFYQNGTQANFTQIYQTVISNDNFYSVIPSFEIIRYNRSGIINETIPLPVGNVGLPTRIALGVDNTISIPKVLVKFHSLYSMDNNYPPQVYTLDDIRTPDHLIPLFNCTNENVHFSYLNGQPTLISTQSDLLVIAKFGEIDGSYEVIDLDYVNTDLVGETMNCQAWVNLSKGIWFAKRDDTSNEANIITDSNASFAGYFASLFGFGDLPAVNCLVYDPINDLVIATSTERQVIFGVKFLTIEKQITEPDDTDKTKSAFIEWLSNFSQNKYITSILIAIFVITVAPIVIYIIQRFRRRKKKV
ncbi:MAG: hypothetical protein ACTSYA_12465 [Candidatus Kariarchaeaceae archaeon]